MSAAVGVYGDPVDVSVGMGDTATTISVPSFVIPSTHSRPTARSISCPPPNILTMDNEGKIVVGRNIPFRIDGS